jgi:hypothetical protein
MRKVVSSSEVAHLWANKIQDEARVQANNFYFNGDTIYSYGRHFPIAVHYKGVVLFTRDTYSNTTSKHIWEVRSAASHLTKIYCLKPEAAKSGNHSPNIEYWLKQIEGEAKKLARARKPEIYFNNIEGIKAEMQAYLVYFKIKLNKEQATKIAFSNKAEWIEASKKADKIAKAKDKKIMELGAKVNAKRIELWKSNVNVGDTFNSEEQQAYYHFQRRSEDNPTLLRIIDNNIETSKGIKMPLDVAKRFYDWYAVKVSKGGCTDCNFKMLGYEVTAANEDRLVVGCHDIPYSEIQYVANKIGWQ